MSLLLSRLSMLCYGKPVSIKASLFLLSNGFSSSLQETPPCSILGVKPFGQDMGMLTFYYGGAKPNFKSKMVPLDLTKEMGTIGASHGWVATLKNDGRVTLQDDLNPVASDTNPKRISLPPFVTLPHCQTQIVTNMAMSSASLEDEDCVVAFKFLGPQLSFCKPAQTNSKWINIKIQDPCFFSTPVMFSKKDDMFRIPGSGGHLIGSRDLHKHKHNPKIQRLQFEKFPKLTKTNKKLLDSCSRSEHLIESRITGETFLVKLYKKAIITSNNTINMTTRAVMVFKIDEEGNALYTKDIGDLRIYISKAEPFAVLASSFPGLSKNCIELSDVDDWQSLYLSFLSTCPGKVTPRCLKWKTNFTPSLVSLDDDVMSVIKLIALPQYGVGNRPLGPWLLWNLWKDRNLLVFEKRFFSQLETWTKTIGDAREWLDSQVSKTTVKTGARCRLEPIQSLDEATLLYTDAAWSSTHEIAGLGMSFTDHLTGHVSTHSLVVEYVESPLIGEALAILEAMKRATSLGLLRLHIFSDSKTCVEALHTDSGPRELYGILFDIHTLSSRFNALSFSFVPRSSNVIADSLAKHSLSEFIFDLELLVVT